MSELLLHPTTWHQLRALTQSTPQAVMISGKPGAGKQTMALSLAAEVLGVEDSLTHPYFLQVTPEKLHISIAEVRKIRDFMSRKTTGKGTIRRIVLIPDAHTMTTEAQNALLKTLEEPPADTMIILTTSDITALKPTIRSRSQHLITLPVAKESAVEYFSEQGYTEDQVQSAFFLSGGEVGLLAALLSEETDHPLVSAISQAKTLLTAPKYERLVKVDELSKQKEQLEPLLDGLQRVITGGLNQATANDNPIQAKRFYQLSKAVMTAQEQLKRSVNSKLLLTNLFLEM